MICCFVPFLPDSPRWLMSKDRDENAITALRRLRNRHAVESGQCEEEIVLIKQALAQNVYKAPWIQLLQGTNFRRTMLVLVQYTFQQITGQAFVSTYQVSEARSDPDVAHDQTVFYNNNGFAAEAFTYPVINASMSVLAVLPAMYLVDRIGCAAGPLHPS